MITREKTKEFIDRAYKCACEHGFHDVERSNSHWMMLVVSEVGEMVEADRKNRHANPKGFETCVGLTYNDRFKNYVKDTLEDELADVCIRLLDFCGTRGIEPENFRSHLIDDYMSTWNDMFGSESVCEQCYELVKGICLIDDNSIQQDVAEIVCAAMFFCYCFAEYHGIDLEWHIEKKIEYNESRPVRHGKGY